MFFWRITFSFMWNVKNVLSVKTRKTPTQKNFKQHYFISSACYCGLPLPLFPTGRLPPPVLPPPAPPGRSALRSDCLHPPATVTPSTPPLRVSLLLGTRQLTLAPQPQQPQQGGRGGVSSVWASEQSHRWVDLSHYKRPLIQPLLSLSGISEWFPNRCR